VCVFSVYFFIGINSTFAIDVTLTVTDSGGGGGGGGGVLPPPNPPPLPPVIPPPIIPLPPIIPPTPPEPPVVPPPEPPVAPVPPPPVVPPSEPPVVIPPPPSGPPPEVEVIPEPEIPYPFGPLIEIIPVVPKAIQTTKEVVMSPLGRAVSVLLETTGLLSIPAIALSRILFSSPSLTVTSLSDVYFMLWRLLGLIFGAPKRKGKPWGTVYDSVTKRPLDPAYVVVSKESGEEISDAITDLDGRYGFFIEPGNYKLVASKSNYSFPTKVLESKTSDELYDNIYHGETVTTKEGEVILRNIPLDPIGFDWNEFEKNKLNLFRFYSRREKFWKKILGFFYFIGLFSSVIATIFDPRRINIVFLGLYLIYIIYNLLEEEKGKAVSVKFIKDDEPIPFAIIKVFLAEVNVQVKTEVADHLGRFYFLVGPGKYYVTVDQKKLDGKYEKIHQTEIMNLKYGVLNKDILI